MPPSSPRSPPPPWIGFGPPVAAAVLLAVRGGLAVAWVPLVSSVVVVAIVEAVVSLVRARIAKEPELRPVIEAEVSLARLTGLAVASLQAMLAVAIGLGLREAIGLMVVAGLLMMAMAMGTGVRRISAGLEAVRAAGHGDRVKGYTAMSYRNKDDPRLWVPKLSGVGTTLNFAHRGAWLILALLLAAPLAVVVTLIAVALTR